MSTVTGNFQRAADQNQLQYSQVIDPILDRSVVGSKVVNGKRKNVVVPNYNRYVAGINRSNYTIALSPAPASTSFTGTSTYQYNMLPNTIGDQPTDFRLTLPFQNTSGGSNVQMSPPNEGMQRIEIYSGQNELLNTLYETDILIRWGLYYNKFQWDQMCTELGYTTNFSPNTTQLNLAPSSYINFSLPLVTLFNAAMIHMEKVSDSLLFKFYFRSAVSGGSGILALTGSPSLSFDVNSDSDIYRKSIDNLYDNNIVKNNYLDCFNISSSYTFTAGQTTLISLQNIQYKVPFLVFCLRSSTSCTNNGLNNFQSLGTTTDSTQFNIQIRDPSSYDILNRGSGLSPVDMQYINAKYVTDNQLFSNQNLYFVTWSTNTKRSLAGDQSVGMYYFDGSLYNLAIMPGNNFSTGTYTLDIYVYYFRSLEVCNGSLKAYNY